MPALARCLPRSSSSRWSGGGTRRQCDSWQPPRPPARSRNRQASLRRGCSSGSAASAGRASPAAGAFALLLTSMHMTLLGALLALAPRPLFGEGTVTCLGLSLDAAQDQHLGGVLMLMIGGAVYLAGGLSPCRPPAVRGAARPRRHETPSAAHSRGGGCGAGDRAARGVDRLLQRRRQQRPLADHRVVPRAGDALGDPHLRAGRRRARCAAEGRADPGRRALRRGLRVLPRRAGCAAEPGRSRHAAGSARSLGDRRRLDRRPALPHRQARHTLHRDAGLADARRATTRSG